MRRRSVEEAVGLITRSSLFDQGWYERQVGVAFPDRTAAATHYVHHAQEGWSPHWLFAEAWVYPAGAWRRRGSDPLSDYLAGERRQTRSPHPLVHLGRVLELDPLGRDDPLGPVDHWLRTAGPDEVLPSPRGVPALRLAQVRGALSDSHPVAPGLRQRTVIGGRVSVILPVPDSAPRAVKWLMGLFREHVGLDLEVLLPTSAPAPGRRLVADVACVVPRATVLPVAQGASRTQALTTGLDEAQGEYVVLLRHDVDSPYWPWIEPLVNRLRDQRVAAAQPLLLAPDRSIASAGVTFFSSAEGELPLLAGMAAADAGRLGDSVPGAQHVIALRAELARELISGGEADDSVETELGVRAWRTGCGATTVVPASRLVVSRPSVLRRPSLPLEREGREADLAWPPGSSDAWRRAGYVVTDGVPRPYRPAHVSEGSPSLRWTIDLAVTDGPLGMRWGDRYFAESLARELEALGQRVTLDPRESRHRPTRSLDDVVLVLRGLDRVEPTPGPCHVLWVISHPEEVTREEAAAHHLVFAASEAWALRRTQEWGLPVRPLLQCTDPTRFRPAPADSTGGPAVAFVGNARGAVRPSVGAALAAGWQPAIFGGDWEGLVDPGLVRAAHVANASVGRVYGSAGLVLNDHWEDMRRDGFLSNRLFDALACGARVVSDRVEGAAELFGGSVQDLALLRRGPGAVREVMGAFPDTDARLALAAEVRARHSFGARARALLEAVLASGHATS